MISWHALTNQSWQGKSQESNRLLVLLLTLKKLGLHPQGLF